MTSRAPTSHLAWAACSATGTGVVAPEPPSCDPLEPHRHSANRVKATLALHRSLDQARPPSRSSPRSRTRPAPTVATTETGGHGWLLRLRSPGPARRKVDRRTTGSVSRRSRPSPATCPLPPAHLAAWWSCRSAGATTQESAWLEASSRSTSVVRGTIPGRANGEWSLYSIGTKDGSSRDCRSSARTRAPRRSWLVSTR